MDPLNIKIDFTGVSAATGGIAVLPAGMHTGSIVDFQHFPDEKDPECKELNGVLYAYMNTDGLRHRERYDLDSPTAKRYLKSFLISAGVPEAKLTGTEDVPFHKLSGRTVYFSYTPPQVDEKGKAVTGSYAKYTFYPQSRFEAMNTALSSSEDSAPVNGKTKDKDSGDEFEYLLS